MSYSYTNRVQKDMTFSWNVKQGFNSSVAAFKGLVTAYNNMDVPEMMTGYVINLDKTDSQVANVSKEFFVSSSVYIPANKTANIAHYIYENFTKASWTANVTIRGCIIFTFKDNIVNNEFSSVYYVNEVFRNDPRLLSCDLDVSQKNSCDMG